EKFYYTTGDIKFRDEKKHCSDEDDKREQYKMPNIRKPKKMKKALKHIKTNHYRKRTKDKNHRGE
ncbi:MAG: hypothetical protein JXA75_04160, partial [Candidatus Thermoplasmatota archaeon]|nr:hypothetical protein [Candidatus Thermoplasmatota archaeon]